jgi:hypothetical protein
VTTLADYAGRTYDVCVFQGQQPVGEALLDQTLVAEGGLICTGIVKAAQAFVLEFLTEKRSMPYLPARGCAFMTRLRSGYLRHESDVFASFALSSADVLDNLAADWTADTPADEKVVASTLTRVEIFPGYCKLWIRLATAAGADREVILPIPTR